MQDRKMRDQVHFASKLFAIRPVLTVRVFIGAILAPSF